MPRAIAVRVRSSPVEFPLVFIISCDEAVRESFRFVLEAHGWQIRTFRSHVEFLKKFDPAMIGCLVLDHEPRGLTGLEFVEGLRELGCVLAVVLTTGRNDWTFRHRARQFGVVVVDPLIGNDFIEAIAKAMSGDLYPPPPT
jgi:FixJ family two-component response regulator